MSKYRITLNGQVYEMEVELITEGEEPAASGAKAPAQPLSAPAAAESVPAQTADAGSSGAVVSPMPGTVVKLMASQGDAVAKGQPVLVLEAMKMENEITAPEDGVISSLFVAEGQTVAGGESLFEIE